jgi:hypothetical protein
MLALWFHIYLTQEHYPSVPVFTFSRRVWREMSLAFERILKASEAEAL